MELDDIKSAWQALDARLARQDALQLELLRGQKQAQARRNLRPLVFGMALQAVLGLGLVLLGVGCWRQNLDVPGLLFANRSTWAHVVDAAAGVLGESRDNLLSEAELAAVDGRGDPTAILRAEAGPAS